MVNRIDRLYDQSGPKPVERPQEVQPERKPESTEERSDGRVRRENVAERIAPHLHDEVVISEEARRISESENVIPAESGPPVDEETLAQVANSWYAGGYRAALELLDQAKQV